MICLWFDFGFVTCLWFWWLGFEVVGNGGYGSGLWWLVVGAVGSGFRFFIIDDLDVLFWVQLPIIFQIFGMFSYSRFE